jgi:hypothetical protein
VKGKEGKIYILRSPYHKDAIVKIGRTSRISEQRAKEISGGTGVPSEFEVLYEEDVFDSVLAEKLVHNKLDSERVNPKREFFKLPLKKAVKVVFETCLEINARKSKEASTRILIVVSSVLTNKNLVQQMAEKLSIHKGGKVGVWMLYDAERANVLLKIGDEWDVSLSPELVNELKQLRGITSVLWASSDLDWLEKKKHENNSWPDHNEDDIPF